jgi:2-hydroxychromene-2-carboxylate isomerase
MTSATWYFDFISPFAYLQFSRLEALKAELDITLKPVLFSGLLKHWGQKGPVEIEPKRRFVYRFFQWQADRRGVPFKMPSIHPFNPLPPLRLAVATGNTFDAIGKIFHWTYGQGHQLDTPADIAAFAREANLEEAAGRIAEQTVKEELRANTEEAIALGVFGVPSFVVKGEIFWGDDATEMMREFVKDTALFNSPEMVRLSTMSMGRERA